MCVIAFNSKIFSTIWSLERFAQCENCERASLVWREYRQGLLGALDEGSAKIPMFPLTTRYHVGAAFHHFTLWPNRIHTMVIKLIIVPSSYVRLQELPFRPPGTISQHSRLHCLLHYIALTSEIIHHFPNIHHFATLHCSVWIWHELWLLDIALPIPVRPTHLTYLPDIPACTSYLRYTYLPISTTHLT